MSFYPLSRFWPFVVLTNVVWPFVVWPCVVWPCVVWPFVGPSYIQYSISLLFWSLFETLIDKLSLKPFWNLFCCDKRSWLLSGERSLHYDKDLTQIFSYLHETIEDPVFHVFYYTFNDDISIINFIKYEILWWICNEWKHNTCVQFRSLLFNKQFYS